MKIKRWKLKSVKIFDFLFFIILCLEIFTLTLTFSLISSSVFYLGFYSGVSNYATVRHMVTWSPVHDCNISHSRCFSFGTERTENKCFLAFVTCKNQLVIIISPFRCLYFVWLMFFFYNLVILSELEFQKTGT